MAMRMKIDEFATSQPAKQKKQKSMPQELLAFIETQLYFTTLYGVAVTGHEDTGSKVETRDGTQFQHHLQL